MAHMTQGEDITDEQKMSMQNSSWELKIISSDGTELSFVGRQTGNTAMQTDFEQFCFEVYALPENALFIKLAFCFLPEVQFNNEHVGLLLESFVEHFVNTENYGALQANAEANNGHAMFLVGAHEEFENVYMLYFIQNNTAEVIMGSNNDYVEVNDEHRDEEGEISNDPVQHFDEHQNLMHTGSGMERDSDTDHFHNNMEDPSLLERNGHGLSLVDTDERWLLAEYLEIIMNNRIVYYLNFYEEVEGNEDMEIITETPAIADEEAAQILGSPSERINYDPENVCVICLDPLENSCEDIKQLPCKHIYHYKCILKSTKIKNSCPICRGKFDCRERQSS